MALAKSLHCPLNININQTIKMKKLTLLLLVSFFFGLSMQAGEITEAQALQKAQKLMKGKQLTQVQNRSMARGASATTPAYYVFNAEKNGGFVVIAGNDLMPEVLGYAERGSFDLSQAPDNVKWLFDYYAEVARSLEKQPADRRAATRGDSKANLIPLLTTQWDQSGIYQQHCPEVNGVKTLTGCVATAMAQVVNYLQWPLNNVREVAGYTTDPDINLELLPARKFNWFGMNNDDIAWLMRYCGQAVSMKYGVSESSAASGSIPGALISLFNFSKSADVLGREEFSDEEWEQLLYDEIKAGRPVIYSGFSGEAGHSFVLHGYKDGKFYVNWGWGGKMDGYFELTSLKPGDIDFKEKQNAVVGLQPASGNGDDDDEELKPEIGFREVHVEKQGQLASLLPESERYRVSRLKITGVVGGKDIDVIRDMSLYNPEGPNQGRLSKLDLSEARIVGGQKYTDDNYACIDDTFSDWIFTDCFTLTEIVLPKTLKTIGMAAFSNTNITSVFIPKSVTKLSSDAFETSALSIIEVEEGNTVYYSKNNAIYDKKTGVLVRGCKGTSIPEGVVEIGDGAFSSAGVSNVVLPKSLKTIGAQAFSSNYELRSLFIPASVEKISQQAFRGCSNLMSITVDKDNKTFDSRDNCNAIIETATNTLVLASNSTVTIPATVKALGDNAFARLNIRKLDIPEGVSEIGQSVFEGASIMTYIVHGATPLSVPNNAFDYVKSNAVLIVPDGSKAKYAAAQGWKEFTFVERAIVEASEFENQRICTVNLSSAGTLESAFPADRKSITRELKVTGPINGKDIEFMRSLCGYESPLSAIDLSEANIVSGEGSNANELPESAFFPALSLENIILPKSLTSIGSWAFQDTGIREFVLPKNVTSFGRDVFYNVNNLEGLSVEAGNPVFDSRNNCNAIIETATNTLRIGCRTTVIPETVTAIGETALSGKRGLKEVNLPSSVTSIGWAAFWADVDLTTVKLSAGITDLGDSPFGGCDNITSFEIDPNNPKYDSRDNCNAIIETATNKLIQGFSTTKIPEGVKTIAAASFRSLSTLTEIEIPASVEKIEAEAFLYCNQMTKVVTHIRKPFTVSSLVFSGDNMKTAVLYVPYGTKAAYANTPGWDNFRKIVEMDYVEGEYAKYAASVATTDFGKAYAAVNGSVEVPVTLVGEGIEPVTNIDYTITTGSTTTEHHLDLPSPVSFMMTSEILVPLEADGALGQQEKTIKVTKVNGVANECTTENLSAKGQLVTLAKKPKVTAFIEEATGTWCGWCARGIPALALLNKVYGKNVITVAVHGGGNDDPMILDNYQLNVSGYPSCMVNRGETVDPYYGSNSKPFGISREVEAMHRSYVPAGIEVEASWANDNTIDVKTTTTFVEDVANANYRIGYLLVADGLKGTGDTWCQSNYYAGSSTTDENLAALTKDESKMKNVSYNYVPVAAYEPFDGIEGSVPASIAQDAPMTHNYQIDITGNTRIQDKENLTVVALLIDKNDGKVVNAAKFSFNDKGGSGTGISDTTFQPESGAANGAWYSLDGRRVEAQPAKPGLYIHNGRKVVTK